MPPLRLSDISWVIFPNFSKLTANVMQVFLSRLFKLEESLLGVSDFGVFLVLLACWSCKDS